MPVLRGIQDPNAVRPQSDDQWANQQWQAPWVADPNVDYGAPPAPDAKPIFGPAQLEDGSWITNAFIGWGTPDGGTYYLDKSGNVTDKSYWQEAPEDQQHHGAAKWMKPVVQTALGAMFGGAALGAAGVLVANPASALGVSLSPALGGASAIGEGALGVTASDMAAGVGGAGSAVGEGALGVTAADMAAGAGTAGSAIGEGSLGVTAADMAAGAANSGNTLGTIGSAFGEGSLGVTASDMAAGAAKTGSTIGSTVASAAKTAGTVGSAISGAKTAVDTVTGGGEGGDKKKQSWTGIDWLDNVINFATTGPGSSIFGTAAKIGSALYIDEQTRQAYADYLQYTDKWRQEDRDYADKTREDEQAFRASERQGSETFQKGEREANQAFQQKQIDDARAYQDKKEQEEIDRRNKNQNVSGIRIGNKWTMKKPGIVGNAISLGG